MNMEENNTKTAIYQSPILKVVELANCDVLTASGDGANEFGGKFLDQWTLD